MVPGTPSSEAGIELELGPTVGEPVNAMRGRFEAGFQSNSRSDLGPY